MILQVNRLIKQCQDQETKVDEDIVQQSHLKVQAKREEKEVKASILKDFVDENLHCFHVNREYQILEDLSNEYSLENDLYLA